MSKTKIAQSIPKSRQVTPNTTKRLYALSGNKCAYPECRERLADRESDILLSQICHIEAAEAGGERYNPDQTDDQRRNFDNLILLCANHHLKTNDVIVYTVSALKKMKRDHEDKMMDLFSSSGVLNKYPTALVTVINQISASEFYESLELVDPTGSFAIESKIAYNDVKRYKSILQKYKIYQGRLSRIYEQIELTGSFKKEQLLLNIYSFYLIAKDKYTNGHIKEIREKADILIEEVQRQMWEIIDKSNNLSSDVSYEAIQSGILVIIVDAFMRCKILEEPNQ